MYAVCYMNSSTLRMLRSFNLQVVVSKIKTQVTSKVQEGHIPLPASGYEINIFQLK